MLVRNPKRLQGREWIDAVEIVEGDVLIPDSLTPALEDVGTAYYLIHSMYSGEDFHRRDLTAAENFGSAAKQAGLDQIIYLGGLGDYEADLSKHLKSRHDTGRILAQAGVPVTEFRAAVIVGSGSISFEMIRYLTERIPVMICPRWVYTRTQPIGIDDVLAYLEAALTNPKCIGKVIEIGGKDIVTYGEMMMGYASVRDLNRKMVPVPLLTPKLSAYWVHWMTPVPAEIAHALVEGLRNEAVVHSDVAADLFPDIKPMDYLSTVQIALSRLNSREVETRWTDALTSSHRVEKPVEFAVHEGMFIERRQLDVKANPNKIYQIIKKLGGEQGWLYFDWLWEIRGWIDRLFGGVGLRRGRRDPHDLRVGDALDFWRVEYLDEDRSLQLRSEMITPGDAWLHFDLEQTGDHTKLYQTAYFAPKGLLGLLYWYILYPVHSIVFSGMIHAIGKKAEQR